MEKTAALPRTVGFWGTALFPVNGMIGAGMSCQVIHYLHEEHDKFFKVMTGFDAIIVRCNPGQIKADGGSQEKFDDAMRALKKSQSMPVWPSPDAL